jgi:hypothetical protein
MPNTPVREAAEGMPAINRRRLLLGLASASAVAAIVPIPKADAAPLENSELIRLGNELPALVVECHAAEAAFLASSRNGGRVGQQPPMKSVGVVSRTKWNAICAAEGCTGETKSRVTFSPPTT